MDCLNKLEEKTFHPLSYVGLIVFAITGTFCLTAVITISVVEPSKFVCHTAAGEKAADGIKEQCYEDYRLENYAFPLYAFMLLNFFPVLFVCLVYSRCIKRRHEAANLPPNRSCCKVFIAYIAQLLFRLVVLAVFLPLQWCHLYPVMFPSQHTCSTPQADPSHPWSNYTTAANVTLASLALYKCKNHVATIKSIFGILLFGGNCFVLLLSFAEIVHLAVKARKLNGSSSLLDDAVFFSEYLEMLGK